MADTPENNPKTRAGLDAHSMYFDEHAMRAFREGLEQARKALRDTDHLVAPSRAKLTHPDQQEEPPKLDE